MSEYKLVQVKMSEETLNEIEKVKGRINARTFTGTARSSVAIADMVTGAMNKGSDVFFVKDGSKYRMTLPGLPQHG